MLRTSVLGGVALALALAAPPASATMMTWKVDQFPEDLATAVSLVTGMSLNVQPGYAQGEAFGVIFRPSPAAYPVEIHRI